jgi:beta-glucosidase
LSSSQDKFELSNGYGDRFGIVYADFETRSGRPMSASFFREVSRSNTVM